VNLNEIPHPDLIRRLGVLADEKTRAANNWDRHGATAAAVREALGAADIRRAAAYLQRMIDEAT